MKSLESYNAGEYINMGDYKSFIPSKIDEDWSWNDSELNKLVSDANLQLGKLDGYAQQIPNVDLYIKMHVKVEANKSSRIEGTRTTLDEDLLSKDDIDPEKRDDWQEVQNYVDAMNYGIERINEIPISTRLIKEIHSILMKNVRGKDKNPGEYRMSQNWIGGSRPGNAVYVPPIASEINNCLNDLEKFINNDKINTPDLVKIAMIHYQFESIHPFLDGNGRTGRIIIPLYLLNKGIITTPCFYISNYIEENKNAYYDFLSRVRTNNDMISWIKFFLEATIETAKTARVKFQNILQFTKEVDQILPTLSVKYENAKKVIDFLYIQPKASRIEIIEKTKIPDSTVNGIINELMRVNLINEITGFSRNKVYQFTKYIELF